MELEQFRLLKIYHKYRSMLNGRPETKRYDEHSPKGILFLNLRSLRNR